MIEKLIELCRNKYITFEISTWHSLSDGKSRIIIFGIGKNYIEFYDESVLVLIEMAIKAIEEHESAKEYFELKAHAEG
jgi:hypothetical protein